MRSILATIIALAALCSTANAQCENGTCQPTPIKDTVVITKKVVDETVKVTQKIVHRVLPPYKTYKHVPYRSRTVIVKRTVVR